MSSITKKIKIFKRVFILFVYLNSIGCTSWHRVQKSDFDEIQQEKPYIRIVLTNGSIYETKNYSITADSLFIFTAKTPFYKGKKTAIPLDNIATIRKLEIDPQGTTLLVIVTVIGIFVIYSFSKGLGSAYSGLGH
jgi:hypothetical protein